MSVIFPGNYVAHLNAYRNQAVFALPGVEFYQMIGVAQLDVSEPSGKTYSLEILSPDLRMDDKPRVNKPFIIPAGASIYRTAAGVANLTSAASATITVTGPDSGAVLTADSDGVFPVNGAWSTFVGLGGITPENSDLTVTAIASAGLELIEHDDQTAILVEVDFFMNGPGPDKEDVSLPYKVEAGIN